MTVTKFALLEMLWVYKENHESHECVYVKSSIDSLVNPFLEVVIRS